MLTDRTKTTKALEGSCSSLQQQIAALKSAIECGELLMDQYSNPAVMAFAKKLFGSEMIRLAKLRMNYPVDDEHMNLTITAQYKYAEKLMQDPETIQESIDENREILNRAVDSLVDKQNKLDKLRSKR